MMLERSRDAAFLNRVLNDPAVLPWATLGANMPLDMTLVLADEANIFLANQHGGFLLVPHGQHIYSIHVQFLKSGRGPLILKLGRQALWYAFTQTDCLQVDTSVAHDNRVAARLAEAAGFEKWDDVEIRGVPSSYYVLTLKKWARSLSCQQAQP